MTSADWSPNKNWVVVSVLENDGATNIYLISTVALGIIKVTNTPKINESFPTFSADGKFKSDYYKGRSKLTVSKVGHWGSPKHFWKKIGCNLDLIRGIVNE